MSKFLSVISIFAYLSLGNLSLGVSYANSNEVSFSIRQLNFMMSRRPQMQHYVDRDGLKRKIIQSDDIFTLATRAFSSAPNGIIFDDGPTSEGANADHTIPYKGKPARIRVSPIYKVDGPKGLPISFEDAWSGFFFEVFNVQNAENFLKIYNRALIDQSYTKENFIEANTRLEHFALLRLRNLYINKIKLWANKNNFQTSGKRWSIDVPEKYEDWIKLFTDRNSYPWNYWGKYFDDSISKYRLASSKSKE